MVMQIILELMTHILLQLHHLNYAIDDINQSDDKHTFMLKTSRYIFLAHIGKLLDNAFATM